MFRTSQFTCHSEKNGAFVHPGSMFRNTGTQEKNGASPTRSLVRRLRERPGRPVVSLLFLLVSVTQITSKSLSSITSNNSFILSSISPFTFHVAICSSTFTSRCSGLGVLGSGPQCDLASCTWRMERCSPRKGWQESLRARFFNVDVYFLQVEI